MRRVMLILAAAAAAASTAACNGGEVVVEAQLEGEATGTEETGTVALGNLPVRLVPFDRDAVFDSLAQAFPEPEPQIPDSILALQDRVIENQREWQQANNRWLELRDRLQALADTLGTMDQGSGEYFALFQEFGEIEERVNGLESRADEAFEEFETLQRRLTRQAREIELERRNWADEAFANVDSVFVARQEELDLEVRYDTTNAAGVVRFTDVPEGQWWVTARYDRPFDELYWNVPVDVAGGDEPTAVRLTEENAEVRQKL
ncbi:MAG: hypothetical protein ACOCVZ_09535 [Gemmatimonadota bacterium]